MREIPLIQAQDPIQGNLGSAHIVRNGQRSLLMRLKEWDAKVDVKNIEVHRMGSTQVANRMGAMSGKFDATLYYGSPIFKEILIEYKRTGKILYFDVITENDDPNSPAGNQIVIYKNCKIDGSPLSMLTLKEDMLDEKVSGTFDDWEIPTMFQYLDGEQ